MALFTSKAAVEKSAPPTFSIERLEQNLVKLRKEQDAVQRTLIAAKVQHAEAESDFAAARDAYATGTGYATEYQDARQRVASAVLAVTELEADLTEKRRLVQRAEAMLTKWRGDAEKAYREELQHRYLRSQAQLADALTIVAKAAEEAQLIADEARAKYPDLRGAPDAFTTLCTWAQLVPRATRIVFMLRSIRAAVPNLVSPEVSEVISMSDHWEQRRQDDERRRNEAAAALHQARMRRQFAPGALFVADTRKTEAKPPQTFTVVPRADRTVIEEPAFGTS